MKAIRAHRFGPPEVLELTELPDLHPGPGQVLVRVQAAGVNPVDTYIRSGQYARLPELPYTPGTDGAGTILRLGQGVAGWAEGQAVYFAGSISGASAETALCTVDQIHRLPEGISPEQGAAIGVPYPIAHLALFARGCAAPGETVLVHGGTGGVGLAAIQFARAAGLTVWATGGTEEGRQLALDNGAHQVFDHRNPDYWEKIASGGPAIDLIIELAAHTNLGRDLALLASGGRVVVVGSRGPVEINPRDLMGRHADIRGLVLFTAPARTIAQAHAAIAAGLENRTLRPVVGQTMPLAEAARAHELVMKSGARGKIVLLP